MSRLGIAAERDSQVMMESVMSVGCGSSLDLTYISRGKFIFLMVLYDLEPG